MLQQHAPGGGHDPARHTTIESYDILDNYFNDANEESGSGEEAAHVTMPTRLELRKRKSSKKKKKRPRFISLESEDAVAGIEGLYF